METITCPECGATVDSSVDACPECGYPFKKEETTPPAPEPKEEEVVVEEETTPPAADPEIERQALSFANAILTIGKVGALIMGVGGLILGIVIGSMEGSGGIAIGAILGLAASAAAFYLICKVIWIWLRLFINISCNSYKK